MKHHNTILMRELDTYDIVHQGCIWKSQDGTWWRIRFPSSLENQYVISKHLAKKLPQMEPDHAANLLAWLERRAVCIQVAALSCAMAGLLSINGEVAQEQIEIAIDAEFEDEPHTWLKKTNLYKSVKELAK